MTLNLGEEFGIPQLFKHAKTFNQGIGKVRAGQGSYVVALDGSGDFDDIQDAINAVPSTGGTIHIKEGIYTLTSTLQIYDKPVSLQGAGRSTKIYKAGGTFLELNNAVGLFIKDIWFNGDGTGTGIADTTASALDLSISGCFFSSLTDGINIQQGSTFCRIINCSFLTISDVAIELLAGVKGSVSNCTFSSVGTGVHLKQCFDFVVNSNSLETTTNYGIIIDAGCNCVNVCDNTIHTVTNYSGIKAIGTDPTYHTNYTLISGNNIYNVGTYGIEIEEYTYKTYVFGNLIKTYGHTATLQDEASEDLYVYHNVDPGSGGAAAAPEQHPGFTPTSTVFIPNDQIIRIPNKAPAYDSPGTPGEIAWAPPYFYVCTDTTEWFRFLGESEY